MSSHEEIIISDDDADIEDVEDINQNLSKGLSSRSKFNLENSNTALFNKYINISHETLKVNHLAMQGNLIAMQNSHLAMKNLQDLTESILKQINFNSINLKDKAKSEVSTSKDKPVIEDEIPNSSPTKTGIKLLIKDNKRLIGKKLPCIIKRLPKNFQLQAKTDRKSEKEFQCSHCPSKFKLNFSLILDKKCRVTLSRISCVNKDKQRQIANKALLLKRKITQNIKKSTESTEGLNLLNSSINKNIRFLTRDVTHDDLRGRKNEQPNLLGYVNTLYVNKPMRLH
ncbi:Protein of unknown function [Cotesia congregata]|uniref:Uncharacterized protein n=1 Tax=Cotesia congregata TaxID=51543 RepID=A0A8J2HCM5_COTCN|nr:Protein of unknown function [Cotesia congregata]